MNDVKTAANTDAKDEILRYVQTNYIDGKFPITIDGATRLRSSGLMDSLGTIGLINFIEKEFDIEFSALELTVDNLDTVDQIVAFIKNKRR